MSYLSALLMWIFRVGVYRHTSVLLLRLIIISTFLVFCNYRQLWKLGKGCEGKQITRKGLALLVNHAVFSHTDEAQEASEVAKINKEYRIIEL